MPPMPSTSFILMMLFCFFGFVISAICLDGYIKPEKKRRGTACLVLLAVFSAIFMGSISSYLVKEENRGRFLPFSRLDDGLYTIANDDLFNGFIIKIASGDIRWFSNAPCGDFRNLPDGAIIKKEGREIKIIKSQP